MASQYIELFNEGQHVCLSFDTLVQGAGIQSNQFLIRDGDHEVLIDPGGELTFVPLSLAISKHIKLENLDYIVASHQDPDIIASVGRWMERTRCKVIVSKLWERFLPHLASNYLTETMGVNLAERIVPISDEGGILNLGDARLKLVPAHFLHSVGNFQLYDPVSKILFSGDMGASVVEGRAGIAVEDFDAHVPHMKGFHQRYMSSNKACRLWANMVRDMDVRMIVPQHGSYFEGKEMVNRFLDWISTLECGIDNLTQANFRAPS